MIKFQDQNIKIYQVDTCVISDFFDDLSIYQKFLDMLTKQETLIGISISTILELKKMPKRYDWFKSEFTALPTFLLKSSEMLLKDEIKSYPYENMESPMLASLFEGKTLLEYFDSSQKFQNTAKFLEKNKPVVLNSIVSLINNFPPDKDGKYSNFKIEEFLNKVTLQQLESFFSEWFKQLDSNIKIETDLFKSLRSQLLITFWKFYLMKDRNVKKSDAFDITIVSPLPYIDLFLTEKNMRNDIEQIKKKKLFFEDLEVKTIHEI